VSGDDVAAAPARMRGWFGAVGALLVLALVGAALVQWRQHQLLNQTVQFQNDYLQVSLHQLQSEYLRLRTTWRDAAAGKPVDTSALQLRYDIFVSRVDLLDVPQLERVVDSRRELDTTRSALTGFVARADRLLGPRPEAAPTPEALHALQRPLEDLEPAIQALSLDGAHHLAEQVAQRNATLRSLNRLGIALEVLLAATTVLFGWLAIGQLRQLERRRSSLEQLASRLGEARRDAEVASDAKSTFLANMSHEIRTPFHGLLGMLSLLRDGPLHEQQREQLRIATESADHLLAILNDVLDMSKLEAGTLALSPEPATLAALVGEVEALMRPQVAAKGLALRIEIDPQCPAHALLDVTRVKQVLFNLLANAIKFTDAGTVALCVRQVADDLEFVVKDTGIGMDEATMARLFQRFTQGDASRSRRHGGAGLGLEISRSLARRMGGDISANSRPGRGSVFVFRLPYTAAAAPAPTTASPPAPEPAQALHVLVAEDHPVNRIYLGALLERLGHPAQFVENGREAVEAVEAATREGRRFDVILMDLHMPELDGAQATERIRALGGDAARTPVIALTADVFPETRERCRTAGMVDFLPKPVTREDLVASLARLPGVAGAPAAPPPSPIGVAA
jgi:hypothetical protein